MSAKYWVAKYVEDVFRDEPKNVGIIVSTSDGLAARFAGERDDLTMDRRRLGQRFKFADVYLQWVDFWREQVNSGRVDEIMLSATPNYFVIPAGEVSDTGDDGADVICNFLFSLLVSDASVMEAFEGITESDAERELSQDVSATFTEWEILADGPTLQFRNPIRKKQHVQGGHAVHQPSFSQRNGKLYLYEAIDFNAKRPKLLRERAGFMAYMFTDIRQALGDTVDAYSLIRPSVESNTGEAVEFANSVLCGESRIINWADVNERYLFLQERRRIAESLDVPTN